MPRGTASRTRINDMNSNSYTKAAMVALYLAFAAISCWATAESLHLLLPDWPQVAAWVVTIGFFVIASWGTKMITDSLNQNIFMEHRGLKLTGGIFIVLVFWLLCSMPTNTHTFYYRSHVKEIVTQDVSATKGYLAQIKDGTKTEKDINDSISHITTLVTVKRGELDAEILNDGNPGVGPKAKKILGDLATLLHVKEIELLSHRDTSPQSKELLRKAYGYKIETLLQNYTKLIRQSMTPKNHEHQVVAKRDWKNLDKIERAINPQDTTVKRKLDLNDAEDMTIICNALNTGYSTIKQYNEYVDFSKNPEDKAKYTAENPQTKVARLLSVYDVWGDFLKDEAGGLHFAFWIFISVLIDIAAFVFFDIAFKKED